MLIKAILLFVFIVFSAFFSAAETAIFSLNCLRLKRMQLKGWPPERVKLVKAILSQPTHFLSVIIFGNMFVNIGLASFSTAFFVHILGAGGVTIAIIAATIIILIFGEIIPKSLAIYSAEQMALFSCRIIIILEKLAYPFLLVMQKITYFFTSFITKKTRQPLTEEEFKTAVKLVKASGFLDKSEEDMIKHILEFKETQASEIMIPRIEIEGLNYAAKNEEATALIRQKRHSKFLVYRDSLDNILGVVYAKDVFLNPAKDWHIFIRPPVFIPETMKIDDILKMFLQKERKIAIVVDEYGGTSGIITVEDIQEEIFGEIYDEFEIPQEAIEKISGNEYRILPKTAIKTINLKLDLDLPEEEDNLAAYLLGQMEKIPSSGETYKFSDKVEFIIEKSTPKRILSVIARIKK